MDLSSVSEVYVGSTKAKAVYLGSTLIWEDNSNNS